MDQLPQITNSRLDLSGKTFDEMPFYKFDPDSTLRVKKLVLFKCGLTAQGLISLSRLNWSNLVELNIWKNKLGSKGCKYISRASLTKLQTLDLGNNQIDRYGVLHLSKAFFGNITEVDLRDNFLSMESVHWLLRLNQPKLTKIWIRKNRVPFNEILRFVLMERKIAQLSVCMGMLIEDENEMDSLSTKQIGAALHQKFGEANINI